VTATPFRLIAKLTPRARATRTRSPALPLSRAARSVAPSRRQTLAIPPSQVRGRRPGSDVRGVEGGA
jgi:hypothetical protein